MEDYKKIPFDLANARTDYNPCGLEVVTENGRDVRIICVNRLDVDNEYRIVALVKNMTSKGIEEDVCRYTKHGDGVCDNNKLYLKKPIERRRMTHRELSWWLRECPEEHREVTSVYGDTIHSMFSYTNNRENEEVSERIKIRVNCGKWKEPLIEI